MKRALIALALLSACKPANVGKDGYAFGQAEYARTSVDLRVVTHESAIALRAAAKRDGAIVEEGRELRAYSVLSARGSVCTVHVVDPARDYQPEWIGHELAHCIWGRWHT